MRATALATSSSVASTVSTSALSRARPVLVAVAGEHQAGRDAGGQPIEVGGAAAALDLVGQGQHLVVLADGGQGQGQRALGVGRRRHVGRALGRRAARPATASAGRATCTSASAWATTRSRPPMPVESLDLAHDAVDGHEGHVGIADRHGGAGQRRRPA